MLEKQESCEVRGGVLVVDDCGHQCAALSEFLSLRGFRVFSATDGFTALSILRRHRPAVAIIDINMPNWDGVELHETICRLGHGLHVVLMSGDQSAVARANLTRSFQGIVIDKPLPLHYLANYLAAYEAPTAH